MYRYRHFVNSSAKFIGLNISPRNTKFVSSGWDLAPHLGKYHPDCGKGLQASTIVDILLDNFQ